MNIGIICYPTYGGSGVVATELGISLAKKGHQVHFISYAVPFRLQGFVPNVYFHEVPVSIYPLFKYPSYDLALSAKMMEVAEQHNLDIFHVHYAIPHAACAYLTHQMMGNKSPKVITTLHGTDITLVGQDKSFFPITKFSIEQSDGVTVVSNYLKTETEKVFGIQRDIRVIPNFVDTEEFTGHTKGCRKKYFAPGGEKVIMHISNFRPVKRIPDVIRIFEKIHEKIPSKLVLVGEGPELTPGLELARSLGIQQDVISMGKQDFLPDLLPCSDLYLLPSETESFGLSALEAMASGVPVIASRVGGLPEVVIDGRNGYLCEIGNVNCMANLAVGLLSDPDKNAQFRKQCREDAVNKFNKDRGVALYEDYYKEILGQGN